MSTGTIGKVQAEPNPNEIKEGGTGEGTPDNKVAAVEVKEEDVAAKKWEHVDDMGLPIVDKEKDPLTHKEVEIVRTLIKQERSHGQWKKQGINLVALFLLLAN